MLDQLSSLSPKQRAALELRLRQRRTARERQETTIPRRSSLTFPLSFSQQRLWFLEQLEPGSAAYNLAAAVRLVGHLDIAALARSVGEVLERNEALRTIFLTVEGSPMAMLLPACPPQLPVIDLQVDAVGDSEEAGLIAAEAVRPFDLAGPLFRCFLVKRAGDVHTLVFTLHHIVVDGWSIGLLLQELATLYAAFRDGKPSPLPPPRIQYGDYAAWQRERAQGPALEAQLAFWRRALEGAPTTLDLLTDRPRPAVRSSRGAAEPVDLPKELVERLSALAQDHQATLFLVVLAALASLLHRYSSQDDLLIGTPVANRPYPELEDLIGFFANTLVLRADLTGSPTFLDVLFRLREMALGAYAHQEVLFERLVDELQPERDPSRPPVFQVMFALQNTPPRAVDLTDLEWTPLAVPTRTSRFEWLLDLTSSGDGLTGSFRYSTELFDRPTILRAVGHLRAVLESVAAEPSAPVAELPLLSEGERHQIFTEWNDTRRPGQTGRLLHRLIETQVARTPDAVAVRFAIEQLSYRELARRADLLARYLRTLGVGPEGHVGIALERSIELMVGLLGVLQAGAAYVPLDPSYPAERLAYMLADAGTEVVLTDRASAGRLPLGSARQVFLDEPLPPLSGSAPAGEPTPASLAYVIYTSGSTGRPKGAMNTHGAIANRLLWMQRVYRLDATDRVLQKTPLSFDVSVWELFWPLLAGASLVLARPEGHKDSAYMASLVANEGITTLHFVPSMLHAFLEEPALARCGSLRRVICSGEALTPDLQHRFLARLDAELHNLYGPTEAAVDVTWWPSRPEAVRGAVPIGRPIDNIRLDLLDRNLEPVPAGVPGELYIGGAGLARGYRGRPDLTAERFVPAPRSAEAGERLYRTGDLTRLRPDGAIEFLGRLDHQIKLRGFRIELGEIESALTGHSGVEEAVVLARRDSPSGAPRLVAYVVAPRTAQPSLAGDLRAFLREKLPDHMIPSAFVPLAALPLTPNGKVDRRALPAPAPDRESARGEAAPLGPEEARIAAIWSELLGVEDLGRDDDFFALGGDSIQAVRLVSRINAALGSSLRVQDIFKLPSLGALAREVAAAVPRRSVGDEHAEGLARIIDPLRQALLADERQRAKLPADWEDVYPLSGIEKGMVYYSLLLPEEPIYHDQFVYLLSIPDTGAFFRAFDLLIDRHPVFRSTYHLYDFPEPVKVVHREMRADGEVRGLSHLPVDEQRREVDRYCAADLARKFTFQGDLLWRLGLFRLRDDLYCSVWTWHHALLDGWSNAAFWTELNEVCGRPDLFSIARLPRPASDYRDYVAITLGRRSSPETEDFWRSLLAGHGRNKLPFNRSKVNRETPPGMGTVERQLGPELRQTLEARVREDRVSLQSICLAAHLYLLHVTTGEDDVVTGVVSHDRPPIPEVEQVLGCFLSTFPIRLRIRPIDSARSLVRRVHDYLRAEKEHELPLADIAAIVGARDTAGNPIFDTLLNYMNFHVAERVLAHNVLFRPLASEALQETYPFRSNEMTNTLLDVEISASLGRFHLVAKYSHKHFEAADIERAALLYQRILEIFAGDFDARLDAELLLSAAERDEILHRFNATVRELPGELALHAAFEEQARLRPDRPAVIGAGRRLTYGELDHLADRLAIELLARGISPGESVGILFERSPEMAVAMLAALKAGAAYVPLEPDYPPARKSYILRQSAAVWVIADRLYELSPEGERMAELSSPRLFVPDFRALAAWEGARPAVAVRPDDLAYTIYTSGSTGRPKGVMIEHRSAANTIRWVNREFAVGPHSTLLMVSSVCFDLSVYDLFGGLAAGASVILAGREDLREPARLRRLVKEQKVTFWNSTPSVIGLLVQYLEDAEPDFRQTDLQVVFLSGDWIPVALPRRIERFFPNAQVISLGGATEAAIWSIFHPIREVRESWASIPYGRPIDNNSFYVLDRELSAVPPGVVGELYIGGGGVARGYAADLVKTAGSFLPDRFAGPGARMYRTSDLGRMLPDGNLEILGRADHQVKIRGFRVELGEVESQLLRHEAVREAAVIDRIDPAGERYLCAYVVAPSAPSAAELKAHLATALPDYMIPAVFIFLPALPLTTNGKLDRQALPRPDADNAPSTALYIAPANEVESALVGIWEEVLGIQGIGTRHDFFELGGHSLSAVQVVTRIRRRFGVDLPLRDLFDAPTVAGVARILAELRPAAPKGRIPRRPQGEDPPLSFAQQRLWFLDQLEPGGSLYNIRAAVLIAGILDVAALTRSLGEAVRRHESLRTRFVAVRGEPIQAIAPPQPVSLPVVDLAGLPEPRRWLVAERLTREEAGRPFDLARGPLLRTLLLTHGTDHTLVLVLHHIVSDGWSMGILVRELVTLYEAFSQGRPSPLPDLAVQYADFASWQRRALSADVLEAEVTYWRESLAEAPPALELPADRPRPAIRSAAGANHPFALGRELTAGLQSLSRGREATPFMTLLAAFATLLFRYTGQDDLCVGTPVAGRNREELENLIGFFVNTLVLRVRLSGEETFLDLLDRVRETTLDAYAHQELPFDKLVEALSPERSRAYSPLFQVMLSFQNVPFEELRTPDLTLTPISVDLGTAPFDLTLSLSELEGSLAGGIEHSLDLFDRATIQRMQGHIETLLAALLENPGRRLSDLSLLTPEERQEILSWSRTAAAGEVAGCIHELIEAQAAQKPAAEALISAGGVLTYSELNARADRLAQELRRLGVAPEVPAGVCLGNSPEGVVAMLAVLKAGGVYLPLDPSYPAERLALMLEDSRARVVVTRQEHAARLPAGRVDLVLVDSGPDARGPLEPLVSTSVPDNLAYLIYTSGSTGRPKGVAVSHRAVVQHCDQMRRTLGIDADDRVLQFYSPSFDASIDQLFYGFLAGAAVVLRGPELWSSIEMLRRCAELRVSVADLPTAYWQRWVRDCAGQSVPVPERLRVVPVGGEEMPPEAARLWHGTPMRGALLLNGYGPTEAVICATLHEVSAAPGDVASVPIGRPLPGYHACVLDPNGNLVPAGVPGELYLGGVLARGYLGYAALTAERFVPDPFDHRGGGRLYRTGDRARHLPGWNLEFLGRIGRQVKVRGFRVELGEIEAVLAEHPQVREAVVQVRVEAEGNRSLIAYVVMQSTLPHEDRELRGFLEERLPDYMVPAAFVSLDHLPLTTSGKVDRQALPAPDLASRDRQRAFVAPCDPIERRLAGIWAEVLRLPQVGAHDSFFEIGGHSLLAVRVVARIWEELGVEIPLGAIFEHPTVCSLAPIVSRLASEARAVDLPVTSDEDFEEVEI